MWLCVICHVAVCYLPCGCVLSAIHTELPISTATDRGGLSVAVRIGGTELPISTATDRGGLSVAVLSVAVRIGGSIRGCAIRGQIYISTELPISTATDRGGLSVAVLSVAVRIGGWFGGGGGGSQPPSAISTATDRGAIRGIRIIGKLRRFGQAQHGTYDKHLSDLINGHLKPDVTGICNRSRRARKAVREDWVDYHRQ
ncbi:hypothetical protein C8R47DRAFT_1082973 [Mycena vitilis]|nr:hypothetical protein C8R47DRAFT_1082973 [Mycena vitilis]